MNVFRQGPFAFAALQGRLAFPAHSLSLIVKATFDLAPGAPATWRDEPPSPTGDIFYPGDENRQGSPRYESDFAPFKPRADLLLVGSCHAPRGSATRWCPATFHVGTVAKTLTVFGDRRWQRNGLGWKPSEPEPFTAMPLRYERSFGGPDFAANPVGSGGHRAIDETGEKVRPLPNLEDPRWPVESPQSQPRPAGFGPLNRMWQTRRAKMGTYRKDYLESRWPWFPEDFDWSHFNAAPEDLQVEGYLRGDEELYFENLHPVHSEYTSRLPGIRVRCFVNKLPSPDSEQVQFLEVPMNLDTLWVDMEAEQVVLVWRGWTEVASEDHEDVQDIFVMYEPLSERPASTGQCYQAFVMTRAAADAEFEAAPEPVEPVETVDDVPAEAPGEGADVRPGAAELERQTSALLAQLGIDLGALPPAARERHSRLMRRLGEQDPEMILEIEQEEVDEQMRAALARLGLEPDRLPPLSAKARAEQVRFLEEMGLEDPHLDADPELTKLWTLMAAVLPKAGIDPEDLSPLVGHVKKLAPRLGGPDAASDSATARDEEHAEEPPESPGRREDAAAQARDGSYAGEDLRGADLSQLDLRGADLSGANLAGARLAGAKLALAVLTGANLEGADLTGADLTGATLARADLTSATLDGATLEGADFSMTNLTGARLAGATLVDATFEKARMAGAVCDRVRARDAVFCEVDLTGASFRESDCSGADFSRATLHQAAFGRARLAEASLEGAVGHQIELADADLTSVRAGGGSDFSRGVFWRATGKGSIWEGANLAEADFRGARLPEALFTGACLARTNFWAADLRLGRFIKADLREAHLVQMNLFRSSLARADLTAADCSGSNLYEAELFDAVIEGTTFRGANLKMTTLVNKVPH